MALDDCIFGIPEWVLVVLGLFTIYFFYFTWNFGYWENHGVKSSKPIPLFGSVFISKQSIIERDLANFRKYGRFYGSYEGRNPCLFVSDPNLLETILIKEFSVFLNRKSINLGEQDKLHETVLQNLRDDEWKSMRNILSPSFSTGKLKQMIYLIEECINRMINNLEKSADAKEPFEAKQSFSSMTLDVIATCAFGTKIDSFKNPTSEFVRNVQRSKTVTTLHTVALTTFPSLMKHLPPIFPTDALSYFKKLIRDIIASRKQEILPRRDFLQFLMEAKRENVSNSVKNGDEKNIHKRVIMEDLLLSQAFLFVFNGLETISSSLAVIAYCLALNEDVQERLHSDIENILSITRGRSNYELLAELSYLEMVISECLRMYPPIVRTERICGVEDYVLNNIPLKKGTIIYIPINAIHHDEEFYPNPEHFDPERFSKSNQSCRNPFTYLPFGHGQRSCLGMRFSLMMIKIAVFHLLKQFKIIACPKTEIPFTRHYNAEVLQPRSIWLQLEPRQRIV